MTDEIDAAQDARLLSAAKDFSDALRKRGIEEVNETPNEGIEMRSLIWKIRYSVYFYRRIGGDCWKDWLLAWESAAISWEEMDGPSFHPRESAEEELSEWRN